jgi:hypothetical protein
MVGLSWAAHGDGSTGQLGQFQCEARLGHVKNRKKGRGKKRPAGPDSDSSWVSSHCQIGTRKILLFFKSFYNLQTNLSSKQI